MEDNFELNLKKLEELVKKLDSDELTLDESIALFEEGMKLSKKCSDKLESAERKINILLQDENGNEKEEKFEIEEN
ncbi:exodeoxyribonuclease VII small subunit [Clostridium sp. CAG:1219]|nr:exodeoxyribonuclease VII small subunit [Clostridium sp. CAG:1219]